MVSIDFIRGKIADDDIEGLFEEMERDVDFMSLMELHLLRWRYTHLKKQVMSGLIAQDQVNLELSKIRKGLLDLAMGGKLLRTTKMLNYLAVSIFILAISAFIWHVSSSTLPQPNQEVVPNKQTILSPSSEPLTDTTSTNKQTKKTTGKLSKCHNRVWIKNHMEKLDKLTAGEKGGYASMDEAEQYFQNFVKHCDCDPEDVFGK
jgi:hypothetical protein